MSKNTELDQITDQLDREIDAINNFMAKPFIPKLRLIVRWMRAVNAAINVNNAINKEI